LASLATYGSGIFLAYYLSRQNGILGLTWAFVITNIIYFFLLFLLLLPLLKNVSWGGLGRRVGGYIVITGGACLVGLAAVKLSESWFNLTKVLGVVGQATVVGAIFCATFFGEAKLFKMEEISVIKKSPNDFFQVANFLHTFERKNSFSIWLIKHLMDLKNTVRNFAIIAHVDHGKSTLADRLLEYTGTIKKDKLKAQYLDQMNLERERGITIKLQPVRMEFERNGHHCIFNLIDTPGHVDFTYEVSRSLAAVEGAILLVDATQGIQAQTIGNLNLAQKQGLKIIGAINKIDLPGADIDNRRLELAALLNVNPEEILLISAKTGEGVQSLMDRIIKDFPQPTGDKNKSFKALVFDSVYDSFRGVIAYVRVVDGKISSRAKLHFIAKERNIQSIESGYFKPELLPQEFLEAMISVLLPLALKIRL